MDIDQVLDECKKILKEHYEHGGFGEWSWAVSRDPGEVLDVLQV